jgi:hypothetical protein
VAPDFVLFEAIVTERIRQFLAAANPIAFATIVGLAGFGAYFAMYAFRKPFGAASYHPSDWPFALDYKIALVMAQVAGYALSKMIGVKWVSEVGPPQRAGAILGLIGLSWIALILFALIPPPWNVICLFLNGLPLGMIWGLVFGYMEGRRTSEVLGAILCASFVLSSGVVKSVGAWLIESGLDVFWMPALAGALFFPLLGLSVFVLDCVPAPSRLDEAERVHRKPMTGSERWEFLSAYFPGILLLVIAYVFLTAFRDFRDNFAAELWIGFGYAKPSALFSASEIPVAVISLTAMALVITVRDNLRALNIILGLILAGCLLLGASTLAFDHGLLSPLASMILSGAGLYMAYVPFNAILFDRLVAYSARAATAGFLIYVADSFGYMGSVAMLLWRNFGGAQLNWVQLYAASAYATSIIGTVTTLGAILYLSRQYRAQG